MAQAYVADVTPPQHRARSLGLIGAAFGVGFVLGPLLGGVLVDLPVNPVWRLRLPFLVAAGFSTLAWLLVVRFLPESLEPGRASVQAARVLSWRGVAATVGSARVGGLVGVGALVVLAFAALEGTFSLFLQRRLNWGAGQAAFAFAGLGLVNALVQGGLIRRLVPKFGEPRLIVVGITTLTLGLGTLALVQSVPTLLVAIVLTGVGYGLANPAVLGLLSRSTPDADQGAVFGTLSSAQTLARMANYLVANALLGRVGASAPYWEGAGVAAIAGLLAAAVLGRGIGAPQPDSVEAEEVSTAGEAARP